MFRFFAVALPLLQDPAAPPGRAGGGVTCEFCGCGLAADGAVLRTSDRARGLARIEEKIERIETDLTAARTRVTELEGELAAAVAKLAAVPPTPAPPRPAGLHFE